MSGKKDSQHVNMAGVTALVRKGRSLASKAARTGADKKGSAGKARVSPRGRR